MLTIKTRIGKSLIHGTGLFADEDVPAGTVIWTFVPGFDQSYTIEEFHALPQQAQQIRGVLRDGVCRFRLGFHGIHLARSITRRPLRRRFSRPTVAWARRTVNA